MAKQLTFDEFSRRIDKSHTELLKTLRKKLTIIALKAEAQAKKNATSFPRVITGRLRSSITGIVDAKDGNPRAFLRAGGNSGGEPVTYARYVEFGTRKMRPRLFMFRALNKIYKEIPEDFKDLLSISLDVK